MLRRLRITASVFFAMVALALCVLWVRTQTIIDSVFGPITGTAHVVFTARHGGIGVGVSPHPTSQTSWIELDATEIKHRVPNLGLAGFEAFWPPASANYAVRAPFWFLILTSTALAVLSLRPISWRFSLRTLLIATTLVAVVLGLGVWAAG